MMGMVRHWRGRLAAPAVALGILGAAIAPTATPSQAQVWGPWGPLPGGDADLPGLLRAPWRGQYGTTSLGGPRWGRYRCWGRREPRPGRVHARVRSVSRGNGADATSGLAEDATFWISDGVGVCATTPCVGRTAIGPEFERQIAVHARYTPLGGDVVGVTWRVAR